MTPEEWRRKAARVAAVDEAAEHRHHALTDEAFRDEFDQEPVRCERCKRLMLLRRPWYSLAPEERPAFAVPAGGQGLCHPCRTAKWKQDRKNSPRPGIEDFRRSLGLR